MRFLVSLSIWLTFDGLLVDHRVGLEELDENLFNLMAKSFTGNFHICPVSHDRGAEPKLVLVVLYPFRDITSFTHVDGAITNVVEYINSRELRAIRLVV